MQIMKNFLLVLICLFLLTACTSNNSEASYYDIEIDMTYQEVIGFLGEPDALPLVDHHGYPIKEVCEWTFNDGTILTVYFAPPGAHYQELEAQIVSAYEIILGPDLSTN